MIEKLQKIFLHRRNVIIFLAVLLAVIVFTSTTRGVNESFDFFGFLILELYCYWVIDLYVQKKKIKNGKLWRSFSIWLNFVALLFFIFFIRGEDEVSQKLEIIKVFQNKVFWFDLFLWGLFTSFWFLRISTFQFCLILIFLTSLILFRLIFFRNWLPKAIIFIDLAILIVCFIFLYGGIKVILNVLTKNPDVLEYGLINTF